MTVELKPKSIYKIAHKLEVFYTGGTARITRDGKSLICPCADEVKIIDVATGAVTRTIPGDSEPITAMAVSPDKRTLVIASRSLTVRVVDLETGEVRRSWRPHSAPVADISIDPSGGYVATAAADRLVKVWDLQGGFATHTLTGHGGVVLTALFHPKQPLLFTAADDGEILIWDLMLGAAAGGPLVARLAGTHFSAVTSLDVTPDGWRLLSGSRDKTVAIWDLKAILAASSVVAARAAPADKSQPPSKRQKKQHHVLTDVKPLTLMPVFETVEAVVALPLGALGGGAEDTGVLGLAGSPGVKRPVLFATAGDRGALRIWSSDCGSCVLELPPEQGCQPGSAAGSLTGLFVMPGGTRGLVALTGDARVLFVEPRTGADGKQQLVRARQLIGNQDEVTDVRLLGPLGEPTHVAVSSNGEVIRVLQLSNLSCSTSLQGHTEAVLCMDTAPVIPGTSTTTNLVVSGGKDRCLRIFEGPSSGRCLACTKGEGHAGAVTSVAMAATFSKIAAAAAKKGPAAAAAALSAALAAGKLFCVSAGADKLLKVWDLSQLVQDMKKDVDLRLEGEAEGDDASSTSAGAAGSPFAAGPIAMKSVAAVVAHDKEINAVATAPNDMLVATGSQDRTARLWKLPGLVPAGVLKGHKRGVWSVQFAPIERTLLTASGDKTIRIWLLSDCSCLRTFEGHTASVLRASWATAGTQVLSSGADGLLKLWNSASGECVNTMDEHEDRVWALNAGGDRESILATGGADAKVVIWHDATAEEAEATAQAEEELVEQEQRLRNCLMAQDYAEAARIAFKLRHPGRLLAVVQKVAGSQVQGRSRALTRADEGEDGVTLSLAELRRRAEEVASSDGEEGSILDKLVSAMSGEDLRSALQFCREWNSNARHCHAAQAMLAAVLRTRTAEDIGKVQGATELLSGLAAYGQRHLARLDRLVRSTHLLEFALQSMGALVDEVAVLEQEVV